MAAQPEDDKTQDLLGAVIDHPAKVRQEEEEKQREKEAQAAEELHLAAEHNLVAVRAFIVDKEKSEKKTKGAARVEKHREKEKADGITTIKAPLVIAEQLKKDGVTLEKWLENEIKTKSKPLSVEQNQLIEMGKKVVNLRGWKRVFVLKILG